MGQDREEGQGVAKGALLERANYYAHNLLHAGHFAGELVLAPKVKVTCDNASAWLIDDLRPALLDLTAALERLANEVFALRAFEDAVRAEIGNTNFVLLMLRADEAEAALAKSRGAPSPPEES